MKFLEDGEAPLRPAPHCAQLTPGMNHRALASGAHSKVVMRKAMRDAP